MTDRTGIQKLPLITKGLAQEAKCAAEHCAFCNLGLGLLAKIRGNFHARQA